MSRDRSKTDEKDKQPVEGIFLLDSKYEYAPGKGHLDFWRMVREKMLRQLSVFG